jgi:hypothetical protein
MAAQVKISGVDILLKDLDNYSKKVTKGVAEEIVDWGARTKSAAKRDVRKDTWALHNTIRTELTNNGLTLEVKAGGIDGVNYAPFIEFGTGVGVDQTFLSEYGLTKYASDFKGNQPPFYPIPAKSFLFRNGREEFEKTLKNIKELLKQT